MLSNFPIALILKKPPKPKTCLFASCKAKNFQLLKPLLCAKSHCLKIFDMFNLSVFLEKRILLDYIFRKELLYLVRLSCLNQSSLSFLNLAITYTFAAFTVCKVDVKTYLSGAYSFIINYFTIIHCKKPASRNRLSQA